MAQSSTARILGLVAGAVIGAFAIGLGVGLFMGVGKGDGVTSPVAAPCPPCPSSGPTTAPSPQKTPENCPPCPEVTKLSRERDRLQAELGLLRAVIQGYQAEVNGTPQPWPEADQLPENQRPENFQAWLAQALDECEVPMELLDFDCSEPPCIARLKARDRGWLWKLVRDCSAWTSRYHRVPQRHSFIVPCGPEGEEQIVFLAPHWTDFPGDGEQMSKRLHARWKLAQETWTCDR